MRLSAFTCLALLAAATPAMAADVGGSYSVAGTNFNGSEYSGTAEITVTSDTTCVVEWDVADGPSNGICMRLGDTFSAGYVLGEDVGLVIYEIQPDGVLNGVWTLAGENGAGTEVLTPQ